MELIQITNHPSDDTIIRKACRAGIKTEEYRTYDQKYVILEVLVRHYKEENGIEVPYTLIPEYVFRLKADNTTFVDPNTGQFVDSSFEGAMGEAEFFIQIIAKNPIAVDAMSEQKILIADQYGRFNNYNQAQIVTWM